MLAGIYMLTSPSGKKYIGQSLDLNSRIYMYKNNYIQKQWAIKAAIDKYGFDSFKVEYLYSDERDNVTVDLLNELEKKFIHEYNTLKPSGYNLTTGGDRGYELSEESKRKISESNKGRNNKSFGNKISNTLKDKYSKGTITVHNKRSIIVLKDNNYVASFNSITEAANYLGFKSETTICNILGGRALKTREGYTFKYKN